MEGLTSRAVASIGSGKPDAEMLRAIGAPDPDATARDLQAAATHPDLAERISIWAPGLLTSARPDFGARALRELADLCRELGEPLNLSDAPHLARLLGTSQVLARYLLRHPEFCCETRGDPPPPPSQAPVTASWSAIREAKYRGLLRIATRDLAARPFEQSLAELSNLADGCLRAALETSAEELGTPAPALFALGKLGGRELNFSSDVDLLFLYDAPPADDPGRTHAAITRLVRHFKRELETGTEDGFSYRVDLDLRPEGRAGVVANSVDAALVYYETFGAEWERQMLIRLRGLAGPESTRSRFVDSIRPFVFRHLIDPSAVRSVRDMKGRIESERRSSGRTLEADLKEGPGGIRDVEFLVQSFQLFHGARHPALRTGNVIDTLDALGTHTLLPPDVIGSLRDGYLWLRRAEHAVQMAEERQTARLPRLPEEQLALARRMGYPEVASDDARAAMLDDLHRVRRSVREHFDNLILGQTAS